jgi:hypothetical protein
MKSQSSTLCQIALRSLAFCLWIALESARAACLQLNWIDLILSQPPPPARTAPGMAYDSFRGITILFGGLDTNNAVLNDTWQFDARGWKKLQPMHSPPARFRHTMSYDASRGVIVLFGGRDGSGSSFGDLWEWNGADWQSVSPDGPAPAARHWHGMAFDSARGVHVLFGGYLSDTQEHGDTWEYNGNTRQWTLRANTGPSPRSGMSLAFDATRNQTLLFGGYTSAGATLFQKYLSDTWTWNGAAGVWTQQNSRVTPQGRALYSLAFDSVRSIVLMQNGRVALDETRTAKVRESWEWDGAQWSEHYSYCCPRVEAGLVYELAHQRMIMFAGDGVFHDGTWALEPIPDYDQNILYVNWNTRPGEFPDTYQTLRQGLNAALNCTDINIYTGDYNETTSGSVPLVITKSVRLEPRPQPGQSARIVRIH